LLPTGRIQHRKRQEEGKLDGLRLLGAQGEPSHQRGEGRLSSLSPRKTSDGDAGDAAGSQILLVSRSFKPDAIHSKQVSGALPLSNAHKRSSVRFVVWKRRLYLIYLVHTPASGTSVPYSLKEVMRWSLWWSETCTVCYKTSGSTEAIGQKDPY